MALIQWAYKRTRRAGRTKALEQAGDWKRLLEHMALLSEANGDHATAVELREQLHPQTIPQGIVEPEPVYTPDPKPKRKRSRRKPAPSSPELQAAWENLKLSRHHG
jgi:hypothetical protein